MCTHIYITKIYKINTQTCTPTVECQFKIYRCCGYRMKSTKFNKQLRQKIVNGTDFRCYILVYDVLCVTLK